MPATQTLNFLSDSVTIIAAERQVIAFPVTFTTAGSPTDVSTWTWEAAIYDDAGLLEVAFAVDTSAAATGTITLTADLAAVTPGRYRWELWRLTPTKAPLMAGPVSVADMDGGT